MSKKRPAESSWDSDEELLNDTSGNAITAFPKTSELDLLGDDGELDEDALLGVDEAGVKTTSISFTNDSMWPLTTRQRSKNALSHQEQAGHDDQEPVVNEQAFVFEETDTADLEDELNVGGQEEDGSGYHVGRSNDYTASLYHQGGSASTKIATSNVDYTGNRMSTGVGGAMGYLSEQAAYGDESGAEFGDATASGDYIGDAVHEVEEDASGVELEYEQPVEQEEQVHLEYEDSHPIHQESNLESHEPKNANYESDSDSDEGSRHSRGKFTSERTGVISLAAATAREAIPDTLEINEEQAAQIEQFMSDKTQRNKGRGKSQGRPSAHSRLGMRPGTGPRHNPKMLQGTRRGPFPRGMLGQSPQMGFPFPGGPPNRGPFPMGLLNPPGPFPLRLLNQQRPFSGPPNQRQSFPLGPGAPRGSFSVGSINMLLGGPQRGPFPQERFLGTPNQRGPFPGGPQPQRLLQQNLRSPQQGPQHIRGPPPNQLRPQGSFNQRMANPALFGQRPPHMGQQGMRLPGPGNTGPRPLLGRAEPGMRFVRAVRPPGGVQQGQPIPSLVKPVANLGKSPQGNQQLRTGQVNPLMPPDTRRISPLQRLGPMQGQNRFQNPTGQPQGPPRFMARTRVPGPFMNFQGNQQPQMGGQGDYQAVRKHKIYINPRFQSQQVTVGTPSLGRTVKMGVPVQQKKAKVLLERAIQSQNKQTSVPVPVAGAKRKSTGDEDVPIKVMKSDVIVTEKSSTRIVQASSEPVDGDTQKMKALLEEQKRLREMVKKKKELARQKQAAIRRKELETRLKEEGKTIDDILGTAKAQGTEEQNQVVPPVKQISGSIAARLGPPPTQQQVRGPPPQQQVQLSGPVRAQMRPPLPQGTSAAFKSQQFQRAPQQSQNFQARTPVQAPAYPNQPRVTGPSDPRMRGPPPGSDSRFRGPPPNSNLRMRGPAPTNDPRFQAPPASNQFRAPQSSFDPRYRTPQPSQDHTFRGPPPNTGQRLRAPPPMTDPRLRAPSHQTTIQSSVYSQSATYTSAPRASPQIVRFQAPHSAPPQVPVQIPASQQFQPHFTPSAQPSHPPSHYSQPSQADHAVYTSSLAQYTPQATSYPPPAYPLQAEYQYQSQIHHPPPASQTFIQSGTSQYQTVPQQQYQTPASQYQASPAQPQYQAPPAQPQYQAPPAQTQYQAPTAQPQYQAPPAQPQYQTTPAQSYQDSTQSYSTPSDLHYQHVAVSYYSEPQPIETVTSKTAPTPPVGDQRTVQHNSPVGQRIQTIGQRVQPVSSTQMRSIIHNVASQPDHAAKGASARLVQSQPAGSRVVTNGQVRVLDGPQKILIQNVPTVATKETLLKICRHFGQVLGVNLMSEQSRAVVQFQKGEQAAKCVAKCDQKCLHKTRLTVKLLPG